MKDTLKNLSVVAVGVVILAGIWFWQKSKSTAPIANLPVTEPASSPSGSANPPPAAPPKAINKTNFPLKLPDGFSIEVFAKNLSGARVMAFDNLGNMWVSRTTKGIISQLELKDGAVISQSDVLRNLKNPHGLAFDPKNPGTLYFAEETKITRIVTYSEDSGTKVADLPNSGGGHFTRTLGFGPDNRLYVSVGSACNVCNNTDARRAAVSSMNADGSDFKSFATGLRNTVFFVWNKAGQIWGTDMGRDNLGDNVPPDEINVIQEDRSYGWPICYDDNIHDTNFDKNVYVQDPCNDKTPPQVKIQAHSAPLGLSFVPSGFGPKDWAGDLIVAFHGSWNRSVPTGYNLVRINLDAQGKFLGTEDFITGWFQGSAALGRPVDVVFYDGALFVSDDKAGVIYKVTYNGN